MENRNQLCPERASTRKAENTKRYDQLCRIIRRTRIHTSDTDDPDSIRERYHIYGGETTRGTSVLIPRLAKRLRTPSNNRSKSIQKPSSEIRSTCLLVLGATPTLSRAYSKRALYRMARYKIEDPVILRCHICRLSSFKHKRLSQVRRAITIHMSAHLDEDRVQKSRPLTEARDH